MSMHRAGAPGSAYGEARPTGGRVTSFASTWAVAPVLSEAGRVTSRPTHPRVDQPSEVRGPTDPPVPTILGTLGGSACSGTQPYDRRAMNVEARSEENTSELQSH